VVSGPKVVLIINWALSNVPDAFPLTQKLTRSPVVSAESCVFVKAAQALSYALTAIQEGAVGEPDGGLVGEQLESS
jgi:hypothetical protein